MILVKKNGSKILIQGHAMYDDYGKDIVCSSVSSIVITTVNGILAINQNAIKFKEKDACIEIEIQSHDNITMKLINNMIDLLTELSNDYPKNIQIKEGV